MSGRKFAIREEQGSGHAVLSLIVWMLGAIIVLPAAVLTILHLSFVQTLMLDEFAGAIERTSGLRVELGSFSCWQFPRLHLRNLTVASMGKKIVECDELCLTYEVALKHPYVQPREIHLQKPVIHIERDAVGRWQIPWDLRHAGKGMPGKLPSWLTDMPWPQLYVTSGTIEAQQNGQSVLSIKEINGILPIRKVSEPDGPRLRIDLGQWGK